MEKNPGRHKQLLGMIFTTHENDDLLGIAPNGATVSRLPMTLEAKELGCLTGRLPFKYQIMTIGGGFPLINKPRF